jgi:hypothetical protein
MTKNIELTAEELGSVRNGVRMMVDGYAHTMSCRALAKLVFQALIEGRVTRRSRLLEEAHTALALDYPLLATILKRHEGHRVREPLWRVDFDGTYNLI